MPASNTKIKKICEWCGTRFEAQKISTKYCSHRCANLAYKKREREKNIKATEENTQNRIEELPIITIKDRVSIFLRGWNSFRYYQTSSL